MSFTLLIDRFFVFISDLPYTGRFDFVQVLQEKDEAMNYSSDEDDIDEHDFDVSRFDIITRQVVATISILKEVLMTDDCVPKFYLLGIETDMKEHKKTVERYYTTITTTTTSYYRYWCLLLLQLHNYYY
jgi:hypothetical protein